MRRGNFAGYGFENDTYSDYKGIDASRKIVILLSGNRPLLTNDMTIVQKQELAARHGAAAVLSFADPGDEFAKGSLNDLHSCSGTTNFGSKKTKTFATFKWSTSKHKFRERPFGKQHGTSVEKLSRRIDSLKVEHLCSRQCNCEKIHLVL